MRIVLLARTWQAIEWFCREQGFDPHLTIWITHRDDIYRLDGIRSATVYLLHGYEGIPGFAQIYDYIWTRGFRIEQGDATCGMRSEFCSSPETGRDLPTRLR